MSLHVILNPASGSGAGAKLAPEVRRRLDARQVDYVLHVTDGPGHGVALAGDAAAAGAERVLSVGGDGTLHEVANGLLRSRQPAPPVAVLPLGTGNDFYRMVGAPREMDAAVATFLDGTPRPFDVGHAQWDGGDEYFVNMMGLGIDVAIIQNREGVRWLSGLAQYVAAVLKSIARMRFQPVRIALDDGEVIEDSAVLAGFTVGPSAAGGFMLSPEATPDDGKLDLCLFREVNPVQALRLLPSVLRGTHGRSDRVRLRRFAHATVESGDGEPFHFEMDGELMPHATSRIVVRVVPGALTVLLP